MPWKDDSLRLVAEVRDALRAGTLTMNEAADRLDGALAAGTTGESNIESCPDCKQPWWSVQVRCLCWPKPGTLEAALAEAEAAVVHFSGKAIKVAMSLWKQETTK